MMKKIAVKRSLILMLAASFILVASAVSFASSGGGGGGEAHGVDWKAVGFQVFNFAVLISVLVFFTRKPFKAFLKARTETIAKTLKEAREARELAEKALKEVEEKLKHREKDFEKAVNAARASGEAERERLKKEAGELAQRAIEQARANIELELREAKTAIKREAVELAMELAEKKIKETMGEAEQQNLLEDSLRRLGEAGRGN